MLANKARKRYSYPASVSEAYMILNGAISGDYGAAQIFLKSLGDEERSARLREEQRGTVKQKAITRYGAKPLSRRSKIYL